MNTGSVRQHCSQRRARNPKCDSGKPRRQADPVGSHYHFYEVNPALKFDREATRGYRLNIPAGTAVRFEPGQKREVTLVQVTGAQRIFGFRGEIMGEVKHG